ncbi:MAG: type I polyketide synthase [Gemmataceae bacterium]|nr:type I polyketide synthase [Gemmataceae bacterium]
MTSIALVGMACRYADARSPVELWENVLAQRQAFRRLPSERLCLEDYLCADRHAPDCVYAAEAALIEGYAFDRVRFRVAGSTFRSADWTHWLALDVAAGALADAGFPEGERLPRDTTGVLLGNTLTGEFSRANVMRLRWPYVRRVVDAALSAKGWLAEQRQAFLQDLEEQYKEPFPPIGEESLAGGLSNTIAGRICNHFDLHGGGYTVDGACASSLLAVTTACAALVAGDLDVALAGGVDLSLDPFELVGFAKAGALAAEEMRVYDARSAGFWPGEGCGIVVLMRHEDALRQRRRIYALLRGWGVSSDGSGGLTRPELEGQLLALRRAYRRAGFGIHSVAYFEGHGTGTEVGDATELRTLSRARRETAPESPAAVVGSIKANIGHTKAAAGVAGLIKAAMALHTQILPPTTGCEKPHPELSGETPALRVLRQGEPWPVDWPLRAGVSAMGFGGINTHCVLEGVATKRRPLPSLQDRSLLSSAQDAELLLLSAADAEALRRQVEQLLTFAAQLSRAEVADLAAQLERTLTEGPVRAAVVASRPAELASRLEMLRSWIVNGVSKRLEPRAGVFLATGHTAPRLGFLFPGQGSPTYREGGAWCRRFDFVGQLYACANLPCDGDSRATAVAQPAIVTASLAALRVLDQFGLWAERTVGHSLGELVALHWAGAFDEDALLRIARARGQAMTLPGSAAGAMASIAAGQHEVAALLNGEPVRPAGLNSPRQTVISGEATAVATVVARARARGLNAVSLPVSHAFHSPLMASAAPTLAAHLAGEDFRPLQRAVLSTITGTLLTPDEDLRALLVQQLTTPVRFLEAVTAAGSGVDLWLEAGPGHVLSGLVAECTETPVVALDAGSSSLKGLLEAVGAAFVLGAPVNHAALFAGRFTRPFDIPWQPRFFASPCERAPKPAVVAQCEVTETGKCVLPKPADGLPVGRISNPSYSVERQRLPDTTHTSPLELVRQLVAQRAELPPSAVKDDSRLLNDLHLNSIAVGQLVAEAGRCLGLPPPAAPIDYAQATVLGIAQALEELARTGDSRPVDESQRPPAGVDSWVRTFTVELIERPLPRARPWTGAGSWQVLSAADHPLREPLQQAFARAGGEGGVVVCLPPQPDERHVGLLLESARTLLARRGPAHFVLVQHSGGGAALARTVHLEASGVTTCVVDVPADHPQAVAWVVAEARAATGYVEAHYDTAGKRREPVLRLLPLPEATGELPLTPTDVLVVTGGGKGIAAECALFLARQTGARLALLGRSRPDADSELAANLHRMTAAGIAFRYLVADVTDEQAVRAALREVEACLGPVTAILHGAGTNVPRLLMSLEETAFRQTLAPKVEGLHHLLAAVDPSRLRLLVTFGSLIARTGMCGEADYAVANEWLAQRTERWQAEHPHCRCLALEWSVWSGVGMGQRLGRVDALLQEGITPISPEDGIRLLGQLLGQRVPAVSVVVTSRFGDPPTVKLERLELPLLRFLERPRVYYPGVELVVEAELSVDTDPYLEDHVFRGVRLLPAVMGLEAMAQAAMALLGTEDPPCFTEVTFARPVVVPEKAALTIRVAALVQEPGCVQVVLRSEETAFGVDHFRATCLVEKKGMENRGPEGHTEDRTTLPSASVPLHPERDLYGGILFHTGRFRRVTGYRRLRATECLAEITSQRAPDWFGRYLPARLVLGDPAVRDAAIHAIQACIPHATVLPIGVDQLVLGTVPTPGPWLVHARERVREGDTFVYDVDVTGTDGRVRERWQGLHLRIAERLPAQRPWVAPLLGPYLERRVGELIPGATVAVAVEQNGTTDRRARSDRLIQQALGQSVAIQRRPDGKPEATGPEALHVSAAHARDLTLAVAGPGPLGCDVEPVVARSASSWRDLLGAERLALAGLIARERGEDEDTAATRLWAATECLKKAGAGIHTPLTLVSPGVAGAADGWVQLAAGPLVIATLVTLVHGTTDRLVFAVLVRNDHARL